MISLEKQVCFYCACGFLAPEALEKVALSNPFLS